MGAKKQRKKEAANWRLEVATEGYKPWDAEGDPQQYQALLERIQELIGAGVLRRDLADVLIGRRYADASNILDVADAFDTVDYRMSGPLVSALINGECGLHRITRMVEAFESEEARRYFTAA